MRNVLVISVIATLTTFGATAHAGVRYVAADASKESSICVSSAVDRPAIFDNKVEAAGFGFKLVATKLNCNGINVALFSAKAGNMKTAARLARYSPVRGEVEIRQASLYQGGGMDLATTSDIIILVKGE